MLEKAAVNKKIHPKYMSKEERERYFTQMREKDAEIVTGLFQNLENKGGSVVFQYKGWPGEEFKAYELRDGQKYQIPRGVARHLNNNCFYREYKLEPGQQEFGMRTAFNDGRLKANQMQMSRKVHRYAFRSLDFMDDDQDLNQANLTEVTVSP